MSKKFVPTDEQRRNVEAMIGFGIKEAEICRLIWNSETGKPIDEKTLRLHFGHEIDSGQVKANAQVAGSLFKDATDRGEGTNPSARVHAASFWLSRRAGWKETNVHEVSGPVVIKISDDDSRL